jgi:hypothetical protein
LLKIEVFNRFDNSVTLFFIILIGDVMSESESESIDHVEDHRGSDRIEVGANVEFRCTDNEDFRTATLVDFSETGMLILLREDHTKGTQFEVRVTDDEAIFFSVTCVRILPSSEAGLFGYGCVIDEHHIES